MGISAITFALVCLGMFLGGLPYLQFDRAGVALLGATSLRDFAQALAESPVFRRFVFANFGRRLGEVIARMEMVALDPVRGRRAEFLLDRGEHGVLRDWTHERNSLELGSVREAVSRNLKQLERLGLVELGRNRITVRDPALLKRQAEWRRLSGGDW